MADYQGYKIQTFTNINDSPVAPTATTAGNGSHLINRYNGALEAIQVDVNQLQGQNALITNLQGTLTTIQTNVNQLQNREYSINQIVDLQDTLGTIQYRIDQLQVREYNISEIVGLQGTLDNKANKSEVTDTAIRNKLETLTGQERLTYTALANTPEIPSLLSQLDNDAGYITASQIPPIAITNTFVVNSQSAMLAQTAQTGDIVVRTDINKSFILRAEPASTLSNWQELLTPTDSVLSVNGKTGAVTLVNTDISGFGTASTRNVPSTGNAATTEVVIGTDTRLTDARTPLAHDASLITSGTLALIRIPTIPNTQVSGLGTASTRNVPSTGNAGTTEVVIGTDTRLSDARTPTAHSHDLSTLTTTFQTFTPALIGTTTAGVFTYSNQSGRYATIGNLIYFTIILIATGTTTAPTGNLRIAGLPISAANISSNHSINIGLFNGLTAVMPISGIIIANNNFVTLYKNNNTLLTATDIGSTFNIQFSGFYFI
jgi:hypothetical protein